MAELHDFEQLASFYLGKKYQLDGHQRLDDLVLYDVKDLTTHAMCVGMTGSGKTGLCVSLLEEAALDGVPAICIDPKGDLGNLLLTFPDLSPDSFREWLDPAEANRKQMDVDQYAAHLAELWRNGLAEWGQSAERIQRLKDSVETTIYTPGSNAGIPLTVLKSFDPPPQAVVEDADIFRERVSGAAAGLLTLLGIEADPLSSREHILLANIFEKMWLKRQSLDLPQIIRAIQDPPFDKVGVFDLESFYPVDERMKLCIRLNNLLASPSFASWLEGEPLDIQSLLYTPEGKPRLSIISIAHLTDAERMFFVTIVLNELLSWMRSQPGTSSLRALFSMDEVYGYFPPTAKPPSKPPMMVLLKQARAFGLGIALATQNPVDLDYKGLSNIGTWFLGRLQTQRDKERVLEGLEGASLQSGSRFQRQEMEAMLAALGNRVFLMNNVHDDGPTVFQTRWAMSYLSGPLSRSQIKKLMDPVREQYAKPETDGDDVQSEESPAGDDRPIVPSEIDEVFVSASKRWADDSALVYRPALLAEVSCHYVRLSAKIDQWIDRAFLYLPSAELTDGFWKDAREVHMGVLEPAEGPQPGFGFAEVPADLLNPKSYKRWQSDLRDYLYRHMPITVFECLELKQFSRPGQDELEARVAWKQQIREFRDQEKEELQDKYAKKVDALESKIRTARQRLERERAQYDQQKWSSMLNIGQTVLGAFLGNKISRRTSTAGRSVGRTVQQRTDVVHAEETLEDLREEKEKLERECEQELHELHDRISVDAVTLKPFDIQCRKGDLQVNRFALVWIPFERPAGNRSEVCLTDLQN